MSKSLNWRIRLLAGTAGPLAAAAALAAGGASPALAKGASYEVLYNFSGTDGANPVVNVIKDKSGNLYGTTLNGGLYDDGTVFKITPAGVETVLYSFSGGNYGDQPYSGLLEDSAGNLYGECIGGGKHQAGTVFKIAPDATETTLYAFTGKKDGLWPRLGLIADRKGNLYGTTNFGGHGGNGTVFEIAPDGTETTLYTFTGGKDGAQPQAGLLSIAGNFYGTTIEGGADNLGVVFELVKRKEGAYTEKVLYSFTGGTDGAYPAAPVIADSAGNLYGTTCDCGNGFGNVFKLAPDGTETTLYSFTGGSDGSQPSDGLIADSKGNFYGTTQHGGIDGYGVVFKLAPNGTETVLHEFTGSPGDGEYPAGSLIKDGRYLYSTTTEGGTNNGCDQLTCGTVFRIKE